MKNEKWVAGAKPLAREARAAKQAPRAGDNQHMSALKLRESKRWLERARAVIPGGVYGHQSPNLLVPGRYPAFISEARGCRVRDPDGNEYIDFLCSYGPMVVGYQNPAVHRATEKQRALCDAGTLPAPNMVELAEKLVAVSEGMDWAMFAKNGSDACTWALALARQRSGRDLIAMAGGSYHGVHGWCNHFTAGFPDSDRASTVEFAWNDLQGLSALFDEHSKSLAAVIVTPFRHEAGADSVMPAEGFLEGIRSLCDRHGALMIVDDVRAGFRLHRGGSTQLWGVTPDLLVYSKALANGYPLSALLGNESLRSAAEGVFVTGTFFTQAVPIAAAIATLEELEAKDGIAYMNAIGERFCDGLQRGADKAGVQIHVSGPPSIPFMTFPADAGSFERSRVFAAACVRGGVFVHPYHNWFMSTAHQESDIDEALAIAAKAFREAARVRAS